MLHFPSFCLDNFYNNPEEIRNFALSLEFVNIGKCQGKRTENLAIIAPDFHHSFCKRLLSIFYDLDKNNVEYIIKSYFHLHPKTDNSNFSELTDESVILAHKYKDFEPEHKAKTSVHLDNSCFASGVIYLNPLEESHAGSAIYKILEDKEPKYITNEKKKEYVKLTANFKQVYNRLVLFDGDDYHGRTGDNTKSERLTHVFFIHMLRANIPTPLNRFKF